MNKFRNMFFQILQTILYSFISYSFQTNLWFCIDHLVDRNNNFHHTKNCKNHPWSCALVCRVNSVVRIRRSHSLQRLNEYWMTVDFLPNSFVFFCSNYFHLVLILPFSHRSIALTTWELLFVWPVHQWSCGHSVTWW